MDVLVITFTQESSVIKGKYKKEEMQMTQVLDKKVKVNKEQLEKDLWRIMWDLQDEEDFIQKRRDAVMEVFVYLRDNELAPNHIKMMESLMNSFWGAKNEKQLDFYMLHFNDLKTTIEYSR